MGQGEVLEILEREKRPLSRKEIAEFLNEEPEKISHIIQKLFENDEIKIIEIDRTQASKLYGSFRKMRLYYL